MPDSPLNNFANAHIYSLPDVSNGQPVIEHLEMMTGGSMKLLATDRNPRDLRIGRFFIHEGKYRDSTTTLLHPRMSNAPAQFGGTVYTPDPLLAEGDIEARKHWRKSHKPDVIVH
jgi:hypothetical protein